MKAVAVLTVIIVISLSGVTRADECSNLSDTSCTKCVSNGNNCYWCPDSSQCLKWNWRKYPECKGNGYFYGQCNLNGVGIIILFSFGLFLLLVAIVIACTCCWCCYMRHRRRREYVPLVYTERNSMQERQRQFQARRDEIRHKYGLDTNDSTV